MPVLPRDPDIDICARTARRASTNYCMDHQVSSSHGSEADRRLSTVIAYGVRSIEGDDHAEEAGGETPD
jgi:hypothetical protein